MEIRFSRSGIQTSWYLTWFSASLWFWWFVTCGDGLRWVPRLCSGSWMWSAFSRLGTSAASLWKSGCFVLMYASSMATKFSTIEFVFGRRRRNIWVTTSTILSWSFGNLFWGGKEFLIDRSVDTIFTIMITLASPVAPHYHNAEWFFAFLRELIPRIATMALRDGLFAAWPTAQKKPIMNLN